MTIATEGAREELRIRVVVDGVEASSMLSWALVGVAAAWLGTLM